MTEINTVIFGDYSDPEKGDIGGRLTLSFQSETLNMDELWESSSLSARFLSTFWGKFLPVHKAGNRQTKAAVEDEVRYISGELLGNAVKFSFKAEFLIEICLYLHENELRIYVKNSVNPKDIKSFQNLIRKLQSEDTTELFLEQMEKNVDDDSDESGVGYLTLLNDYDVKLAWKFESAGSDTTVVTVLAKMMVLRQ